MKSFRLCLGLFAAAIAALSTASAQSPEKPVPVREEPNHVVTFENNFIRMIDVHFSPGKTSLYHVHTIPSVVVQLADAMSVTQEWGAAPTPVRHVMPGETRYVPYDEKPLTHRVTNAGQTMYHVLDIELLRNPTDIDPAPLAAPADAKLEWEQKLVRLFRFEFAPRGVREVVTSPRAHLLICVEGAADVNTGAGNSQAIQELKSGDYRYFPPGVRLRINNPTMDATTCVLLEVK